MPTALIEASWLMCALRIASASAFAETSSTGAAGAAYGLNALLLMVPPFLLCHPFGDRRPCFVQRLADDVHQGRLARGQRLAQNFLELARLRHAPASHAEALGHPGMVGHAEVDRAIALLVTRVLP